MSDPMPLDGEVNLPRADPCVLVIFGASGDLTYKKLLPAIFRLFNAGCLAPEFQVLGIGAHDWTTETFRARSREGVAQSPETSAFTDEEWVDFVTHIHYMSGDLKRGQTYREMRSRLKALAEAGGSTNQLFYCSTPPSLAPSIVDGLREVGIALSYRGSSRVMSDILMKVAGFDTEQKGWARIIIEKPFGQDLLSAAELNAKIGSAFDESQVYRIDHYLGKETVQNLLVFRFGNALFEPVWNRNYVDYVEITAAEPIGIGGRAGYYEEAGALKDMVANHLLQLLTLTAMEPPVSFDADSVREQKVQILRSILPMTPQEVAERTVRGQYGSGTLNEESMAGYREEPGVSPTSVTETYVAVEFQIENRRWAGIPFYLRAGKRLTRHLTEINVHFKRTPHALFARTAGEGIEPNVITIRIQPDEAIRMTFGAKRPGTEMTTGTVQMDFSYQTGFGVRSPSAYETLLLDAMRGDATLFTRRDEVEAEWKLITPIRQAWDADPPKDFPNYEAGSDGPIAAIALLAKNGHAWRPLSGTPKAKKPARAKSRTGVLSWPSTRMLR